MPGTERFSARFRQRGLRRGAGSPVIVEMAAATTSLRRKACSFCRHTMSAPGFDRGRLGYGIARIGVVGM